MRRQKNQSSRLLQKQPGISVILTVISLGMRVLLAYLLSSVEAIGVIGIWMSVPIGWILADIAGVYFYRGGNRNKG